ncbi:hypothetical protein BN1723_020561, partial [Verticillium longisporum]
HVADLLPPGAPRPS